ncbi:hypothetical protein M885DRAFT_541002 [Pelagophyceae sp. CCMP2097]|nr:hypothetical protein M885DRAFT_541002 [Pelagophyceae sp. CCMP2097]
MRRLGRSLALLLLCGAAAAGAADGAADGATGAAGGAAGAFPACRAAVCISGHVRSFGHAHVRAALRGRLLDALGCAVDLYFHIAVDDATVKEAHREWDGFTCAPTFNESDVARFAEDLGWPVRALQFHQEGAGAVPHRCGAGSAAPAAFPQLHKVAACWGLIADPGEYDWFVRVRPDLAWLAPVQPLRTFARDRVYVSGHFWPIGDQFAIVPAQFARVYFRAIESYYECRHRCDASPTPFYLQGTGAPESLLLRHLAESEVPAQLYDGFAYAIARHNEGANCLTLHLVHHHACVLLDGGGGCQKALFDVYRARCEREFPPWCARPSAPDRRSPRRSTPRALAGRLKLRRRGSSKRRRWRRLSGWRRSAQNRP